MATRRFKADPNDFIILTMGPTGSGKSNFINTLTGNAEQRRAGSLKSDTQDVTPHTISYLGLRLVLVDTPGFDNTYLPDFEVLRKIADFLTQRYLDGTTLRVSGILYFHRITDNHISSPAYKSLQIFGRICGNIPLHRTCLVTTMWDQETNREVAENREKELTGNFWQKLLQEGAVAKRFDKTQRRAFEIVDELINLGGGEDELLLQEELVEQGKCLDETEAGKMLYSRFQQLLVERKKALKDLVDEAKLADNPALAKSLQEEYDKINTQLQKTFEGMEVMKIPFTRRFLLWLSGGKSRTQAVKLEA